MKDYPNMYDQLQKEELGFRREQFKKVYLVLYNLFQFCGFMFILIVMAIRWYRDGPASMSGTYEAVGNAYKFVQLLQYLEVMHPIFRYTKGSAGKFQFLFSLVPSFYCFSHCRYSVLASHRQKFHFVCNDRLWASHDDQAGRILPLHYLGSHRSCSLSLLLDSTSQNRNLNPDLATLHNLDSTLPTRRSLRRNYHPQEHSILWRNQTIVCGLAEQMELRLPHAHLHVSLPHLLDTARHLLHHDAHANDSSQKTRWQTNKGRLIIACYRLSLNDQSNFIDW